MQTKHTQTPWRIMRSPDGGPMTYNDGKYFKITAVDNKESMYIYVGGNSHSLGRRQRDVEFVEKAVNAHENLLEILTLVLDTVRINGIIDHITHEGLIEDIEQVLKSAGEI